jgi:alpha-beta hydrolase superfamily lysophospholipase
VYKRIWMSELPGPIEPTNKTTIATPTGALYAETFVPTGSPKGVVLITHGYAEHCGRYREVAHVLVNAGWAALSWDVRGHGQSPGRRGYIDRFETYLADFRAAYAAAKQLAPGKPIVLLGHSHGSLITLRALADDRPPEAACAIVSSPYLGLRLAVPGYKKLLARIASTVNSTLTLPNQLRVEDLTADKQKQAERVADMLCFDVSTARWFTEGLAAQAYVLEHADRIAVPTTWLVGEADPIADPAASRRVADRMKRATYHGFAGLRHEVFNEVERGRVFSQLTAALDACGAATA